MERVIDLILKKIMDGFHTLVVWLFNAFLVCYGIPALVVFTVFILIIYGLVFLIFELPSKLFPKKPTIIIIGGGNGAH